MAITRKFLEAMGIEESKADEIVKAYRETVDEIKGERDALKEKAEKYDSAKKELTDTKKELTTLRKSIDNADNPYKEELEKVKEEKANLQKEYDTYKADITSKELHIKKKDAVKKLLKESGISTKHLDLILKATKVDDYELDDNGAIKDADSVKDNFKKEYSGYIATEKETGANTATPPSNTGNGDNKVSRGTEIARKYRENLYGKGKE